METQVEVNRFPVIRSGLPLSAPFEWLRLGWGDLRASGSASLFYRFCFAAGGLFAGLVFALSVVSIPMMLDRNEDTITAMLASFLAFIRNFPVMLV
jgi:uncharacterized membrane protein